ncbi:MAG: hypothetical protein HC803_08130, partial [Saprospiraceae bacterium]|nr:hypothetical protein [Saprospiraceae bacterium]
MANIGRIKQIIGPVVDVSFSEEGSKLPKILNGLKITKEDGSVLIFETQQHLGEDSVRAIAMDSTEGLTRGMEIVDMESPITVPIGDAIKGRFVQCSWRTRLTVYLLLKAIGRVI